MCSRLFCLIKNNMIQPFIQYLLSKQALSQEIAQKLSDEYEQGGRALDTVIFEGAKIEEEKLLQYKGEFYHLPAVDLAQKAIPTKALGIIPKEIINNYQMIPFDIEGEALRVAMVNPANLKAREAVDFLARQKGWNTQFYVATSRGLKHAMDNYGGNLSSQVEEALEYADEGGKKEVKQVYKTDENLEEVIKSAPVSKMVSVIMRHAVEGGASDIHIEPGDKETRVRYRVDGELHSTLALPKYIHASIVSRIKVMANLKLDETRKPQDGRIHLTIANKEIDLRVSTLPLTGTEKVVMRILDVTRGAPKLEELGFIGRSKEIIEKNIQQPNGLFLVTGPTGSGKSTTLFSALSMLNKEAVNIITLEDPVEYHLEGANQSQVRAEVGYTFASGLRSILRQDPDIIMVGEIRDNETAQLAVQAALTGHFVLSTLHTNSAAGAIPRLLDMKAEPFLLASTINMIEAQRLVRRICKDCKEADQLTEEMSQRVQSVLASIPDAVLYKGINKAKPVFYKGKGCGKCSNTGYLGRLSIIEIIENTKELNSIIAKGFSTEEANKEFIRQGFVSMIQDGVMKAALGLTTVEDIIMATKD